MRDFFTDLAVEATTAFPVFCLVMVVLWRLRARPWTALLGFGFEMVFLLVGYAVAPGVMHSRRSGPSAVQQGIVLGCGMPMVYLLIYHMVQRKEPKDSSGER